MSELNSIERFEAKYPKSKLMFERSLKVGRGMNHDSRYCDPFSIIASHANGSRKWDIDGNEHIDYSMGHAALLFGHCHPAIVSARFGAGREGFALRSRARTQHRTG